jgi:hypothetical protein
MSEIHCIRYMVNEQVYFQKLQEIIRETKSADMINERWSEVLEKLDQLSIEYCKELQAETGASYEKNGKHDIWLFPPLRLLAMNLILSYWIGWMSVPKKLNSVRDWKKIQDAYTNGSDAFFEHKKAESG